MNNMQERWHLDVQTAQCPSCGRQFIVTGMLSTCPRCCEGVLEADEAVSLPSAASAPELMMPFSLDQAGLEASLAKFVKSVRYKPEGLNTEAMMRRVQRVCLPSYTVTSHVDARWQVQMGYDYKTITHVERYANGGWRTNQAENIKTDWYPRAGHTTLQYSNLRTAAMLDDTKTVSALGAFSDGYTQAYDPSALQQQDVVIGLPTRSPDDGWSDIENQLLSHTVADAVRAAGGDRVEQFEWRPTHTDTKWNYLLKPLYTTYYQDEDKNVVPVVVHALTGAVSGTKHGSMSKAKRMALILTGLAVMAAVVAAVLYFMVIPYVIPIIVAVILLLIAGWQLLSVSNMNKKPIEIIW